MQKYHSKKQNRDYLKFIDEASVNMSQHDYDAFLEESIESFRIYGMSSVIIRRQLAKCCDWCAGIAGVYPYEKNRYPQEIFHRHENCRCMVTVKTEKSGYQNSWTKITYKTMREARIARTEELGLYEENEKKFAKKKAIAKEKGEKFVDATEYWENKREEYPAKVVNSKLVFVWDGETYGDKPEHKIIFDPSDNEKRVARLLRDRFGGTITLMPRVDFPTGVKVSDYLYKGDKIDLKTIEVWGEDPVFRIAKKAKGQANNVIIDISKFGYEQESAIEQAKKLFVRKDTKFIDSVAIVNGDKFVAILEKIK